MHAPTDAKGKDVTVGSRVRLLVAPADLLSGLPDIDQTAIMAAVGKEMMVENFDNYGHAELMFTDAEDKIHFIWVPPSVLEVLS